MIFPGRSITILRERGGGVFETSIRSYRNLVPTTSQTSIFLEYRKSHFAELGKFITSIIHKR